MHEKWMAAHAQIGMRKIMTPKQIIFYFSSEIREISRRVDEMDVTANKLLFQNANKMD